MYKKYRTLVASGIFMSHVALLYMLTLLILEKSMATIISTIIVALVNLFFDYMLVKYGLDVFVPPHILKEKS